MAMHDHMRRLRVATTESRSGWLGVVLARLLHRKNPTMKFSERATRALLESEYSAPAPSARLRAAMEMHKRDVIER